MTERISTSDARLAVVRGALEAIREKHKAEGPSWTRMTIGATAPELANHLGIDLAESRNLLAQAERAGVVRSIVLRVRGFGRGNSRQTFKRKFYTLASDNR
ncbi:MAG: hypothetical protein KAI25_11950 [Hyphomicrobiaceae bacterium]|nr:hypothetical protein [Hyphomicrobiaceae bacterium]